MPTPPKGPRLLAKRPPRVDEVVDRLLLRLTPAAYPISLPRRVVRDAVHFSVSLASELTGVVRAAPAFLGELTREGLYPERMTARKLPYRPEVADLAVLREANPQWQFRADFDPSKWVFVFLHGYVDNTGADRIAHKLARLGYQVYLVRYPFLRSVRSLADELGDVIADIAIEEPGKRLVPMGHSLGGLIWDHLLLHDHDAVRRYRMPLYIPLGSPHFGTFAAFLAVGDSGAEMRPHSDLINEHRSLEFPPELEIYPFVSRFDLLVLPIETALLARGINYVLSETGHVGQIINSTVVTAVEEIIATPPAILSKRAEQRPFHPSLLASALNALPPRLQRRLGVEGVMREIFGDGAARPRYRVRGVRHELDLGIFPALRRP